MTFDRSKFKPASYFAIFEQHIKMEFGSLREYVIETSELLISEKKKIEEHVKSAEAKLEGNTDFLNELYDFYQDDYERYSKTYVKFLLNNSFVTSFSLFESLMEKLCKANRIEVVRGDTERYRKSLIDSGFDLAIQPMEDLWRSIVNHREIRNRITHNYSDFWNDKTKLREEQRAFEAISSSPYMKIENDRTGKFYISDAKFVLDFIEKSEAYLQGIVKIIQSRVYVRVDPSQ